MNSNIFHQLFPAQQKPTAATAATTDPLFDDWLVQDALDDGDSSAPECSCSSTSSPGVSTPRDQYFSDDCGSPTPTTPIKQEPISMPPCQQQKQQQLIHDIAQHPLTAALAALMTAASAATAGQTTPPPTPPPSAPASTSNNRRKRSSSLSPQEEAAIKRQKNTDAARRSRLKKVLKMEALERRVSELEKINADLALRVAVLNSEKTGLANKEQSYEERIKMLETQLAEAHKALARP